MEKNLTALLQDAFKTDASENTPSPKEQRLKPGERRDTAVLFLDLAGFTKLSGTLDHETVHALAGSIMNELVRTAQLYRGYVDKIEGDRIMVLFGAVVSGENDSRTAVLCGFRMLEVLAVACGVLSSSCVTLGARIGISSGPVTVAPDAIGHLTAMGNTVNIASRMEELAELNSILVTDRVHSMCSQCAQWALPVKMKVKGVDEKVTVWKPLELLRPGCEICNDAVFVGRKTEYDAMKKALDLASAGRTGINPAGSVKHLIVEITGDAGSGKTRLALEFIRNECRDRLFLRGRSYSEGQPAHWLWSSVISSLLGFQTQRTVAWNDFILGVSRFCSTGRLESSLPFLGRLVPSCSDDLRLVNLGNQALTLETHLAVRDFLEELAKNHKIVVLLEDTHWMDSTDSQLLDFIAGNSSTGSPLVFILTGRNSGEDAPVAKLRREGLYSVYSSIELGDLTREECGKMAASVAERFTTGGSHQFSDHALDLLWLHSAGNPFFLRELVMHLLESGGIQQRGGVWRIVDASVQMSCPESLTGVLQSRLDNLPDKWRKTLLLCAVFGTDFLLDTYKMVCGKLNIPCAGMDVFTGLVEKQMLVRLDSGDMTGFMFRHPMIQRTACESNLSHNMKLIHRAAAEAVSELFENDEERISAKLALHWEGAGEPDMAAKWAITAQMHASDNYQHTTVLYWGGKLLQWLSCKTEEFLKVLELNAKAYLYTGRSEEHLSTLTRMKQLSIENGFHQWKARALMDTGSFCRASGNMDEALENLSLALDICRHHGYRELESNTLGNLGVLAADMGDIALAKEYFTAARNIHAELGNRRGEASTLGNLGIMLRNMQETIGAEEYFRKALTIFQDIGDIRSEAITRGNLGNISHDRGDHASALKLYTGALNIFTRIGDRRSQGVFLGNLGILNADMGKNTKAQDFYDRALAISMETGNLRSRGWTLSNKASLCLKNEDIDKAYALYNDALQLFQQVKDNRMVAITLGATGYTRFLLGNIAASAEDLNRALEMINRMNLPIKDFEETLLKHHEELLKNHRGIAVPDLPGHWN